MGAGKGGAKGCGRGVGWRERREAKAVCGSEGLEGLRRKSGRHQLGLEVPKGELTPAADMALGAALAMGWSQGHWQSRNCGVDPFGEQSPG